MTTLAIDCAGKTASVAILQDEKVLFETFVSNGHTHSETLLPLIDTALRAVNLTTREIDLYAVTIGPGSFTGLRIGIATVKGLALVHGTPCVGVSALRGLAGNFSGVGTVVPTLDARRERVYWAGFDLEKSERLHKDDVCDIAKLRIFLENCKKPCFFVGDGETMCYNMHRDIDGILKMPSSLCVSRAVGVGIVGQCMHLNGESLTPEKLQPLYLQPTQAERERTARLNNL